MRIWSGFGIGLMAAALAAVTVGHGFSEFTRSSLQDEQATRVWTDSSGQHRTEGSFVELKGNVVSLLKPDGEVIQVPLSRLSSADRVEARRLARVAAQVKLAAAQEAVRANTTTQDGQWPQWRGPRRDGISDETGLLQRWPDGEPPVLFKVDGLGGGFSSVAIADGRLFTMGKFGDQTRLIARDADTGKPLWEAAVGQGGEGPNCTPTVDDDRVYALSHAGDLLCADAATGQEIWRTNFPKDFGGQMMSVWGYSESPLVDGDHLIVTPGAGNAMLAALNKRSGEVLWRTPMPANPGPAGKEGAGYSSIVISNARGVKQYIQLVGQGLIGVDARTGRFLWGYNRIANSTANIPTPVVTGDFVFCSSGYDDGGSALLRITGGRNQLGIQEVWYKPSRELQNHHGGMILLGDHLYMGHGHNNGFPVCIHLQSGRDVWRPGRGPGSGSAAVAYADGHLYFRYENGIMALIEATPEDYRQRGQFRIGIQNGQSWPHPVIAGGKLYLRDQHELICYDIRRP